MTDELEQTPTQPVPEAVAAPVPQVAPVPAMPWYRTQAFSVVVAVVGVLLVASIAFGAGVQVGQHTGGRNGSFAQMPGGQSMMQGAPGGTSQNGQMPPQMNGQVPPGTQQSVPQQDSGTAQ